MDQTTQQNAALVEEASAAAQSLQEQAGSLSRIVGRFKLDHQDAPARAATAPTLQAAPAKPAIAAPQRKKKEAPALAGPGDWETF
jgi:hypothetical protein